MTTSSLKFFHPRFVFILLRLSTFKLDVNYTINLDIYCLRESQAITFCNSIPLQKMSCKIYDSLYTFPTLQYEDAPFSLMKKNGRHCMALPSPWHLLTFTVFLFFFHSDLPTNTAWQALMPSAILSSLSQSVTQHKTISDF